MSIETQFEIQLLDSYHNKLDVFGSDQGFKERMPVIVTTLEEIKHRGLHIRTADGVAKVVDFEIRRGVEYMVYHFWSPRLGQLKKVYGRDLEAAVDAELRERIPRYGGTILTLRLEMVAGGHPSLSVNGVLIKTDVVLKANL